MRPGDRLVCALVKPLSVGAVFTNWPLHVTIVPWFRLDDSSEHLSQGLQTALTTIQPFEARIIGEARFGPRRNRPAHLLEPDRFSELERRVRAYLHKKRSWLVDETTKIKRPYKPHITYQGDQHLAAGQTVFCDRLYIIEQKGDQKAVSAITEL